MRKKYSKRIFSRTPLLVTRIKELSKDDDPHLDQSDPLTVINMDPRNPESEALGVSNTEPWPEVGSNPSIIKLQHPKPNHCSGGEESTFRFPQGFISSVSVCRWQREQQKEKCVPRTVLS